MMLFSENPTQFMNDYSREFEKAFLLIARIRGKRLKANDIYREVISDRHHIHMNATTWSTLSNFVTYLGKSGKCEVDQVDDDWYVRFIDPNAQSLQHLSSRRAVLELEDEERDRRLISQQMASRHLPRDETASDPATDRTPGGTKTPSRATEAGTESEKNFRKFSLRLGDKRDEVKKSREMIKSVSRDEKREGKGKTRRRKSELEKLMEEEMADRAKAGERWLREGLVVRIMHKFCGGKFYKRKAVVKRVRHCCEGAKGRAADVEVLKSGEVIRLQQADLENVLPPLGKPALVIKGKYKGNTCKIVDVYVSKKTLKVQLERGRKVDLSFGSICMLYRKTE